MMYIFPCSYLIITSLMHACSIENGHIAHVACCGYPVDRGSNIGVRCQKNGHDVCIKLFYLVMNSFSKTHFHFSHSVV
jgi:hypothetical protein